MTAALKRNKLHIAMGLLIAFIAAMVLMGSGINDGGGPGEGGPNGSGGGTTSTTALADSVRTSAVKCFGAEQIVWTIKATTGQDTVTIVQVSQDSTHWHRADAAPLDLQQYAVGYAAGTQGTAVITAGDSLNKGPFTITLRVADKTAGSVVNGAQIPHRYARLFVQNRYLHPITGLHLTCRVMYGPGANADDYANAYNDSP